MLVEAHRAPFENMLFHTLQLHIFRILLSGKNVVLSATTSVGKSLVVDAVISAKKFNHVAIIVPTIALIDETRRRLTKSFATSHDIITHPTQKSDPTRATIFVLTQERALARDDLDRVEFFVIDEFYKLDLRHEDQDRAVDLNLCFNKLARQGSQFYLIGPHINAVDGLASEYEHFFIPSEFATVAFDLIPFGLPRDGDERKNKLIELCREIDDPTLIYCQSPPKAAEAAECLLRAKVLPASAETNAAVAWLEREYPEEWVLTRALRYGIGIHHGNVPRAIQQYMVRAFEAGAIKFLICTSTIIEGVNTVAKNMIVYDRRLNRSTFNSFTFKNIAGRAGRMGKYFVGKVYLLEEQPDETELVVKLPIENQTEDSPMALILELPEEDLAPVSRERVEKLKKQSPLSFATLQKNRHIPADRLFSLYHAIRRDPDYFNPLLSWRGMPDGQQLRATLELLHAHIDKGNALNAYGIISGSILATELNRLRSATRYRDFLDQWVARRRADDTVSEAVERALKFMRRYAGYTFGRQLSAVEDVQAEAFTHEGIEPTGDYSFYAGRVENLFLDAGLFALDEYGIPPETARRFRRTAQDVQTLDGALSIVRNADLSRGFDQFERELLDEVRRYIPERAGS